MNVREAPGAPQAGVVDAGPPAGERSLVAVPNVSEGRDPDRIEALVAAARAPGVRVLDVHSDADHDRTVLTLAGRPAALLEGLGGLAEASLDLIDLRRARGVHPRVGALDVAPIVVRAPGDAPDARAVATALAERIGVNLAIPVFLYGDIASDPERARPHAFRTGGSDELERRIDDGELEPDVGPPRLHPTAGATLVGVRPPLIAWNVWLPEASLSEARALAARIRESGGGLPGVRALGVWLPEPGVAQLTMNMEQPRLAGPVEVMARAREEAARLSVTLGESELVGLVPRAALARETPTALGLRAFRPGQLLEAHLPHGRG